MNLDSVCNKQLLRNQLNEPRNVEAQNCAKLCSTCNSSVISPRILPPPSYRPSVYIYNSSDWEICEELRLRELEEAKARAAQMEKTMRWWSDCTANWREKWSKVRAERNKACEEGRQLKLKLEASMKELSALRKINQCLLTENEDVVPRNVRKKSFAFSEMCLMTEDHLASLDKDPGKHVQNKKIFEVESICEEFYGTENPLRDHQDKIFNLEILDSIGKHTSVFLENPDASKENETKYQEDEVVHISVLHLHLQESRKILRKEQKIRLCLEKEIEKLKSEKILWKWKYEELRKSKQQNLKQNLVDLPCSDGELYKQDQDILAELTQTKKKAEQHKAEAKKLGIRIEDLRRKFKEAESKKPSETRKESSFTHNSSSP